MNSPQHVEKSWWYKILIGVGFLYCFLCIALFAMGLSELMRYVNRSGATIIEWLFDLGVQTHESSDFSYSLIAFGSTGVPLIICLALLVTGTDKSLQILRVCLVPCIALSAALPVIFASVLYANIGGFGLESVFETAIYFLGSLVGYFIVSLCLWRGRKHLKSNATEERKDSLLS